MAQFQQMFGVDYQTALAMMQMLHPGGSAMAPQQPRAWRIPRAQIR